MHQRLVVVEMHSQLISPTTPVSSRLTLPLTGDILGRTRCKPSSKGNLTDKDKLLLRVDKLSLRVVPEMPAADLVGHRQTVVSR